MMGDGSESALLCFVVSGGVAGSFLGIGEGLAGGGGGGTLGALIGLRGGRGGVYGVVGVPAFSVLNCPPPIS